ncbi:MAG TPA: general secretion pathway protein GspB [Steroidobacteraceae bacterium]|nr:general secretion pathway protein GspB [Steroidobacteraceae bacterium]
MSFILDALRKSEHERERGALPGLVDLPVSRSLPSKLPLVLASLGALLVINVAVLSIVLLKPTRPAVPAGEAAPPVAPAPAPAVAPAPAPPAAAVPDAPKSVIPPAAAAVVPSGRTRPLEAEAGGSDETSDYPEPPAAAASAPDPSLAPRAVPGRPVSRTAPQQRGSAGGVPTLDDLPPQLASGLPRLNIDLHVYSPEPAQSFVMLNGQRLHEGGQLREGPTLERITPDGVILNYQGARFLLRRE